MSIFRNVMYSIISIGLLGWAISSMYYAQMDFAKIVKTNQEPPWSVEINILPVFLAIVVGIFFTAFMYPQLKKNRKSWKNVFLLPLEFEEGDEREKELTGKACRASYISMWYAFPIITALFLLYPFISDSVPYYPIILFLLCPLIQIVTYFISWKRNY
ncbi:hypothetical protein [Bacillus sp. REN16]|uniref:hypothetical protein n=1 Tax=Bacillus sp. REN16 TaxID=2887296 RepID=UPI001E6384C0|nr:hypothetical protein [Bacillus sp. REN16]MCC3356250.1 hypothetical protein [Bacillus sp. REN16]